MVVDFNDFSITGENPADVRFAPYEVFVGHMPRGQADGLRGSEIIIFRFSEVSLSWDIFFQIFILTLRNHIFPVSEVSFSLDYLFPIFFKALFAFFVFQLLRKFE